MQVDWQLRIVVDLHHEDLRVLCPGGVHVHICGYLCGGAAQHDARVEDPLPAIPVLAPGVVLGGALAQADPLEIPDIDGFVGKGLGDVVRALP